MFYDPSFCLKNIMLRFHFKIFNFIIKYLILKDNNDLKKVIEGSNLNSLPCGA